MKLRPPLEKVEQQEGVKLLRMLGSHVYILGTKRRAGDYQGTNQTPGIADVEAFLPAKAGHPARILKWEVKRERGSKASPDQVRYAGHCTRAGVAYVIGTARTLTAWLVAEGYLPNLSHAPRAHERETHADSPTGA